MHSRDLLISADKQNKFDGWEIINDSVMGGLSLGNAQQKADVLIFSGSENLWNQVFNLEPSYSVS